MDRRTLVLSLTVVALVVALGVVGVLILRKRAGFSSFIPIGTQQPVNRKLPTDTKPYDALPNAQPWKQGDPVPSTIPSIPSAIPLEPSS